MVTNRKVYGRAMSMPAGIGLGASISLLVMLLGCGITAMLLDQEVMKQETVGYAAMGILFASSVAGSLVAVKMIKHRLLLVSMVEGVCYYALLLLINGLLFGGAVSGAGVTALLILGGSLCPALLQNTGKGGGNVKIKKVRTG